MGAAVYAVPMVAKAFLLLMIPVGLLYITRNRNRNEEALIASAYVVGIEVFFRMTGATFLYEFGKYVVILFIILGFYYSGFSRRAMIYWVFLLLLVPAIVIGTQELSHTADVRKVMIFNMSGPVCLGLASIYTYKRPISFETFSRVILMLGLPIVSVATYLQFYTPDLREALTGTGSNFQTSGGFGPNQVSTVLGLGIFVFASRILLNSREKIQLIVNLALVFFISYRGLVTMSRGGMITGFIMILVLYFATYRKLNKAAKTKMVFVLAILSSCVVGVWLYTSTQTGGLIDKRYANQDAAGRDKESQLSGREEIMGMEIEQFLEHPVLGIGVGKAADLRRNLYGEVIVSHSEITRMLAEHGAVGIVCLLILGFTPLVLFLEDTRNVFIISFVLFWLLTINHAAMRIAAPAFVYSLSLIRLYFDEKPDIHREQARLPR